MHFLRAQLAKNVGCAGDQRSGSPLHDLEKRELHILRELVADDTWADWDRVTRVGWRHESRESQVDFLLSSEETPLLDVGVYSSLVGGSDHLAVVGTYQVARGDGSLGPCKRRRIPGALCWTASDPVAWEKAVGESGEFGADWRDALALLGFLARARHVENVRRTRSLAI